MGHPRKLNAYTVHIARRNLAKGRRQARATLANPSNSPIMQRRRSEVQQLRLEIMMRCRPARSGALPHLWTRETMPDAVPLGRAALLYLSQVRAFTRIVVA
jgi:hypothetical protein